LKKIHFPDNDRTSVLRLGLRNGAPDADEAEGCEENKLPLLRECEFNRRYRRRGRRRSASFTKQKPTLKMLARDKMDIADKTDVAVLIS
jgi:hypothetical protein